MLGSLPAVFGAALAAAVVSDLGGRSLAPLEGPDLKKDLYGKLLVLVVFLHRNGCAGLLMRTARTARRGMDSPSYIGEAFPVRRSPRLRGEKVD